MAVTVFPGGFHLSTRIGGQQHGSMGEIPLYIALYLPTSELLALVFTIAIHSVA